MNPFYKYQGAGNDFVMIDNRATQYLKKEDTKKINRLCDRRFGIGGDGLILLQHHPDCDFEMVYFNADGTEGSMCGNGGRCTVAFAHFLGMIGTECTFMAVDGPHEAIINKAGNWVELKMIDVNTINCKSNHYVLNTGSPHYVTFVEKVAQIDVFREGRNIRYNDTYAAQGINVNFVENTENGLHMATYERGVEAETLACGTGVTAAAIAYACAYPKQAASFLQNGGIPVKAKGGDLIVRFKQEKHSFSDIWLCGPATFVYSGEIKTTY